MCTKGNVDVIIEDLKDHPSCSHGPTVLFSRTVKGEKRNFFACAAYRERKYCSFFLWECEKKKISTLKRNVWQQETKKLLKVINHRKKYTILNKIYNLPLVQRIYCHTCSRFLLDFNESKHISHELVKGICDDKMNRPSEILPPLEESKKEAQYLFSKCSVETLVNIFRDLNFINVICIGTPRIHEHIRNNYKDMNSILLDIDNRFHNFFGPLEYCWYNLFNHHFFFDEARTVFKEFLKSNNGQGMVLITDPPFGGRIEPIAFTLRTINNEYRNINNINNNLPVFWIFPYFMEPQILNNLPDFKMLDYKVDYENHSLFHDGPKGRKHGSPVRIFTNLDPSLIKLPEYGYRYCKLCKRWVSKENNHCYLCNACTSKDGRTYVHCSVCNRCVKPTWKHCNNCGRCTQIDHKCSIIEFSKDCFHCKEPGHKKSECLKLNQPTCKKRRSSKTKTKSRKKIKLNK